MPSVIASMRNGSGPYVYYTENRPEKRLFLYCGRIEDVCHDLGVEIRGSKGDEQKVASLESAIQGVKPGEFAENIRELDITPISPESVLTVIDQVSDHVEKRVPRINH